MKSILILPGDSASVSGPSLTHSHYGLTETEASEQSKDDDQKKTPTCFILNPPLSFEVPFNFLRRTETCLAIDQWKIRHIHCSFDPNE